MKLNIGPALSRRNMTQTALADAVGVKKGFISEIISGKKLPSLETLEKIIDALGADPSEIYSTGRTIAIAGKVGAGAEIMLTDDHAKGDGLYHIECPPQLSGASVVAVEVSGTSMEPVYFDGDILFYTRDAHGVPGEAVGLKCVCEDTTGHVWIKQVKAGSEAGLFNLLSINPTGTNMHDIRLKWAATVRLHLPKEFVRRA